MYRGMIPVVANINTGMYERSLGCREAFMKYVLFFFRAFCGAPKIVGCNFSLHDPPIVRLFASLLLD